MDFRKFMWGFLLVILGGLFILKNLNIIFFTWHDVVSLWPLLLIFWGISIIPLKSGFRIALSIIAIVLGVVAVQQYEGRTFFHFNDTDDEVYFDENDSLNTSDQSLFLPFEEGTEFAQLDFEAAAGTFLIGGNTENLVDFDKKGHTGNYRLLSENEGDKVFVSFDIGNVKVRDHEEGEVSLMLNPEVLWDINIEAGAANLRMDLSEYRLGQLNIDGGASSISLNLGIPQGESRVDIDMGAASLEILIPQSAQCEIRTSTVLSSRDFEGFEKLEKGVFRTPGFDEDKDVWYITIDAAVSDLSIERY